MACQYLSTLHSSIREVKHFTVDLMDDMPLDKNNKYVTYYIRYNNYILVVLRPDAKVYLLFYYYNTFDN